MERMKYLRNEISQNVKQIKDIRLKGPQTSYEAKHIQDVITKYGE